MKIIELYKNIVQDILETRLEKLPKRKLYVYKPIRIIILAFKGFDEDLVQLRASALTFYSMLSIVPVLAMIFGIAKGFGFEKKLEAELLNTFAGYEDIVNEVMGFVHSMIQTTKGGIVAGVGLALLLWSVIKVLGSIEKSFNDIWKIQKSRSFMRKFSDYLSMMLIAPILILISSSTTVYITSFISNIAQENIIFNFIGPALHYSMKFIPYFLIWILLTFVYLLMPNTKVKISSALVAGITAGTIYQLVQWTYIHFQISISHYNAIYGSFAALPLLLIWMRLSWLIVLFGAEISFAHQNIERYEYENLAKKISPFFKRLISLRITNLLFKNFHDGNSSLTSSEISNKLEVPIGLVRKIVNELLTTKILSETITQNEKECAYQPAKDINQITIIDVINALDSYGKDKFSITESKEVNKLKLCLGEINKQNFESQDNLLLKDV